MKALIIAEHNQKELKPATLHAITATRSLTQDVDILIMGHQCESVVTTAAQWTDKKVIVLDAKEYEHQLAENTAQIISELAKDYQYVMMAATTFGKNILPRVAALLDVSMIADVIKIVSPDTFTKPIYAGNAISTVKTNESIKLLTIRTTAFPIETYKGNEAEVVYIQKIIPNEQSEWVSHELTESSRPELTNARIVISGGRGLKNAENFKLIEQLADRMGAAVGASRAAVDAGFAPNDYQVGQTGKVVAPDLYLAIGISGAIQHLAGMKDSKVIVAINKDPDAPIFQIADIGLVADLFPAIEELLKEL